MDSSRSTRNSIAGFALAIVIGFGIGIVVQDIPFITFKREIDLGTCISILGLIATIFIMPFVVQKKLSKQDNINSVILIDLEAINTDVSRLREIYVGLKPSSKISKTKYLEIIALFKTLSMEIISLDTELKKRKRMPNFKAEVYEAGYNPAWERCTDSLIIDGKLDAQTILNANSALNDLCAKIRTYRYETYTSS